MAQVVMSRDRVLIEAWMNAKHIVPETGPHGPHFCVTVIGVVDDPRFRQNGEDPFQDYVAWWPALRIWTVTHQCAADEDATDFPVNVSHWQKKLPMPWASE